MQYKEHLQQQQLRGGGGGEGWQLIEDQLRERLRLQEREMAEQLDRIEVIPVWVCQWACLDSALQTLLAVNEELTKEKSGLSSAVEQQQQHCEDLSRQVEEMKVRRCVRGVVRRCGEGVVRNSAFGAASVE